ncbi:MAG TPA: Flp family type IVb pilin [Stellaceae bacterium]|nr:Flp family type IVb pilin [Stellaceae bacterium]HMD67099.1 Flp family type IVb pilin [Stellaceae bacterium]
MSEPSGKPPMAILITKLMNDESGVTAIEYGLIASLIVIGSFLALNSVNVSLNLSHTFGTVASHL